MGSQCLRLVIVGLAASEEFGLERIATVDTSAGAQLPGLDSDMIPAAIMLALCCAA